MRQARAISAALAAFLAALAMTSQAANTAALGALTENQQVVISLEGVATAADVAEASAAAVATATNAAAASAAALYLPAYGGTQGIPTNIIVSGNASLNGVYAWNGVEMQSSRPVWRYSTGKSIYYDGTKWKCEQADPPVLSSGFTTTSFLPSMFSSITLSYDVGKMYVLRQNRPDTAPAIDTGWFRIDVSRLVTSNDLAVSLSAKANTVDLSPVASSGSYTDLIGAPNLSSWPSLDIATNLVWSVVVSNGHWLVYENEVVE